MKRIQLVIFLSILFSSLENIFSQPNYNPIVSPQAAGMQKFIDFPVDLSTGLPSITIPLYTIKLLGLEIPLAMSYHSGGIKVDQEAGRYGLGWSLTGLGMITRKVNGIPDEKKTVIRSLKRLVPQNTWDIDKQTFANPGFLYNGQTIKSMTDGGTASLNTNWDTYLKIGYGALDSEPDVFYFNFGRYSGEFFFDTSGNIQLSSSANLRITPTITTDNGGTITSFVILDPEGNEYTFDVTEYSKYTSLQNDHQFNFRGYLKDPVSGGDGGETYNPYDLGFLFSPYSNEPSESHGWAYNWLQNTLTNIDITHVVNTAWYVSKIKTVGGQIVTFQYRGGGEIFYQKYKFTKVYTQNRDISGFNNPDGLIDVINSWSTELSPLTIKWTGGKILFNYPDGGNQFDKMAIIGDNSDYNTASCVGWNFSYDYFSTDDCFQLLNLSSDKLKTFNLTHRLKLTSISKFNSPDHYETREIDGLSQLKVTNAQISGQYTFGYDERYPLPNKLSPQKDFWGFYNHNGASVATYDGYIPDIYFKNDIASSTSTTSFADTNVDVSVFDVFTPSFKLSGGANRNSNADYITTGVLNKITYPTGGRDEFNYEIADFIFKGKTIQGGGIRLNSVKKYTSSTDSNPLTISYAYKDPVTNASSGVLLSVPRFVYLIQNFNDLRNETVTASCRISDNPINELQSFNGCAVQYSYITEIHSDSSKIAYNYSTPGAEGAITDDCDENGLCLYKYVPRYYTNDRCLVGDYRTGGARTEDCKDGGLDVSEYKWNSNFQIDYNWGRGQLLHKTLYDNGGNPVQKITNTYSNNVMTNLKYIVFNKVNVVDISFLNHDGLIPSYRIFDLSYPYLLAANKLLTKSVVEDFNTGGTISTTTDYTYSNNFLHSACVTQSDGTKLLTSYKYPADYFPQNMPEAPCDYHDEQVLLKMFERHQLSTPLETVKYKNDKVIGGTFTKFDCFPYVDDPCFDATATNLILPRYQYALDLSTPIDKSSFTSSAIIYKPTAIIDPNYKLKTNFDGYDNTANLLQYHKIDGINVSYVWGYNHQYPITEVKNATSDQVKTALSDALITRLATSATPSIADLSSLNGLRTSTALPNIQVTTYTYKPLVGILTKTDPRGVISYYNYDSFNRLQSIKDKDGKTVQTFEYNYKH